MPKLYKMKTHTGKVLRTKGGKSHLRRNRSKETKGLLDTMIPASHAEKDRLKALLPYGAKYIR
jgi:large subunit ribosomal protein L35